jgi:cell division septation protein DedD
VDKEGAKTREKELSPWTERQGVVSFVILIVLCLSFYTLGIFVGRWSSNNTSSQITNNPAMAASMRYNGANAGANETAKDKTSEEKPIIEPKNSFLPSNSEKYSVQVASPNSQEEADKIVEKLRKIGLDSVHVIAPQPNSVAQFYIVRVGPYDVDTARQVAEELQNDHNFRGVQVMPKQTKP